MMDETKDLTEIKRLGHYLDGNWLFQMYAHKLTWYRRFSILNNCPYKADYANRRMRRRPLVPTET